MEGTRDLSLRLYNVLENVGASEELRRLHRDTAVTKEILHSVFFSVRRCVMMNEYNCGSSYEGTVTPDLSSDADIIVCHSDTSVVSDVQAAPHGLSLLIVRDAWTYPGQVKLQWVWNGHPQDTDNAMLLNSAIDWKGRMCWKPIPGDNMHGPACMGVDENGVHVIDHVDALRCQRIPPYALEWFLRERPYGRPSQEQLHEMSRLGSMFVGVGYVYSGEKTIEWRLSFTLQERQLMSELNPVQHKVYVLLKMIKNNILRTTFNDETLTSYHCKTCILFAVQMTPARAWVEENLITCLLQCLHLLVKWIEQGNCPNYFIKHQNLFIKEGFPRLRVRLLYVMRLIIETHTTFLFLIQSDSVGTLLINGNTRGYRERAEMIKSEYVYNLKCFTARYIRTCTLHIIECLSRGCYETSSLIHSLDVLQKIVNVHGHSAEVTQSSLLYLYPFFHLHIANSLVSLAFKYPEMVDQHSLVETVDFHFSRASGLDLVNKCLARATVLYKSEHYEECFLLLQEIENDFVRQVTLICPCSMNQSRTYLDIQDQYHHDINNAGMSMGAFIQSSTASCVIFLPSEVEIVPVPLQYEMQRSVGTPAGFRDEWNGLWFDWAVVDPKIYMYFLQYLVTCQLNKEAQKKVAIYNLRAEVDEDNMRVMSGRKSRLGHKETAYNLIGWIHVQEGRFAEACLCFNTSWKIRPYHNASKFHMYNILAKLTQREI